MSYNPPPTDPSTGELQKQQQYTLEEIGTAIEAVAAAKGIASDLRVTLLSGVLTSLGTVTTVTTVSTVTTVGSVTAVAGITNIGAQPATTFLPGQSNQTAILSNVNNVVVS